MCASHARSCNYFASILSLAYPMRPLVASHLPIESWVARQCAKKVTIMHASWHHVAYGSEGVCVQIHQYAVSGDSDPVPTRNEPVTTITIASYKQYHRRPLPTSVTVVPIHIMSSIPYRHPNLQQTLEPYRRLQTLSEHSCWALMWRCVSVCLCSCVVCVCV